MGFFVLYLLLLQLSVTNTLCVCVSMCAREMGKKTHSLRDISHWWAKPMIACDMYNFVYDNFPHHPRQNVKHFTSNCSFAVELYYIRIAFILDLSLSVCERVYECIVYGKWNLPKSNLWYHSSRIAWCRRRAHSLACLITYNLTKPYHQQTTNSEKNHLNRLRLSILFPFHRLCIFRLGNFVVYFRISVEFFFCFHPIRCDICFHLN